MLHSTYYERYILADFTAVLWYQVWQTFSGEIFLQYDMALLYNLLEVKINFGIYYTSMLCMYKWMLALSVQLMLYTIEIVMSLKFDTNYTL